MKTRAQQRGSALLLSMVVAFSVAGLSATYLSVSFVVGDATDRDVQRERALYISEAAVNQGIYELNAGDHEDDADWSTEGSLHGGTFSVAGTLIATDTWQLTSSGSFGSGTRGLEVVVYRSSNPVSVPGLGAIVNLGSVSTLGGIAVDGRDWDIDGTAVVGAGVDGIVSGSTITRGGNSTIGGNGIAPVKPLDPATVSDNHDWSADGVDNNADGDTDELGESFPSSPDQSMGLAEGTLQAAAVANGTYFASQAEYDAYFAANGNSLPGGQIYYLDFDTLLPANIGINGTYNDDPSIFVMHNSTSTALMKNLHGNFKGLIICDKVEHINGDTNILGMVFSWYQAGNTYGNGNANVRYSSEVLGMLPSLTGGDYEIVSWRQILE